jgi:SET domain-containing protein
MYASLEKDDKGLILILSADNTRFLNHSDNPNIACPDPFTLIAIRDIKKDEELTINYRTIDENMKHYNGSLEEYFKKMDL